MNCMLELTLFPPPPKALTESISEKKPPIPPGRWLGLIRAVAA
jgi:hypothetical protein